MIVKHVAYYAAAAATAVAGVLHLMLGPGILGFNMNQGILFIVGGMAQVFWIIPMVRRWGRGWYTVGIAGTAVFMALFFITRLPGNPITGRGAPTNSMSLLLEIFQGIFIALAAAVLAFEIARGDNNKKPSDKKKEKQKAYPDTGRDCYCPDPCRIIRIPYTHASAYGRWWRAPACSRPIRAASPCSR